MTLISVTSILLVVGFVLWLINAYITMALPIKIILNAVVVIVVVIWLLTIFDVIQSVHYFKFNAYAQANHQ